MKKRKAALVSFSSEELAVEQTVTDNTGHTCSYCRSGKTLVGIDVPIGPDNKPVCMCIPRKTHTEKRKVCIYSHVKEVVWTNAIKTITTVGTIGSPIYDVVRVDVFDPIFPEGYSRSIWFRAGTYIQTPEQAKGETKCVTGNQAR